MNWAVHRQTSELRIDLEAVDEMTGLSVAELCYNDLASFWQFFWPIVPGGDVMTPGWHYDYTADRVQFFLERGYGTLGIAWPFGTGKSTALAKLSHPWDWMHRPNMRWLSVGASNSIFEAGRHSRDVIRSPEYQMLVAMAGKSIDFTPDQNAKKDYTNTQGGQRHSYRVGDALIGVNADRLIADDVIDPKKVDRGDPVKIAKWIEVARDKWKKDWSDRLRKRPDTNMDHLPGVRIHIGQRTALGDLTDMLIEQRDAGADDIELIVIPGEYDPDVPGGPCPADPRTEPGELLNPDFRSKAQIDEYRKTSGDRFVDTRINQRPTPAGGGILKPWYYEDRYPLEPHVQSASCADHIITLDCAEEVGSGNDWSVAQLWGRIGRHFFLLWEWRERLDITGQMLWLPKIAAEAEKRFGVRKPKWLVENASNGTKLLQRRPVPRMMSFTPIGTKYERAYDLSIASRSQEVHLPTTVHGSWGHGGVEATIAEWGGLGVGGTHDDRCDTASMAVIYFTGEGKKKARRSRSRNF